MSPTIRNLLTSVMIAAVAPIGLAALDLERPAFAGNGNGGMVAGTAVATVAVMAAVMAVAMATATARAAKPTAMPRVRCQDVGRGRSKPLMTTTESEGLAPNELGKLNGVLHASPNAIAHASANSPIGTAREFGAALAGFLDPAETPEEGEAPAEGEEATTETRRRPSSDLAEMMARMTNKPVTADQVQAVAEKVGIETTDEAPADEGTTDEAAEDTTDDPTADVSRRRWIRQRPGNRRQSQRDPWL